MSKRNQIWTIVCALSFAVGLTVAACGDDDSGGGDAGADTDSDADTDADSDADTDADTDTDTDTDTDADGGPDSGTATCADFGGACTENYWDLCPAGTEPYGDDEQLDCTTRCCVDAPEGYTCSEDEGYVDCVPAATCTGCWGPDTDTALTCEDGRACCTWICDE